MTMIARRLASSPSTFCLHFPDTLCGLFARLTREISETGFLFCFRTGKISRGRRGSVLTFPCLSRRLIFFFSNEPHGHVLSSIIDVTTAAIKCICAIISCRHSEAPLFIGSLNIHMCAHDPSSERSGVIPETRDEPHVGGKTRSVVSLYFLTGRRLIRALAGR